MIWDSKQGFLGKKEGEYYGGIKKQEGQLPCHQAQCPEGV